MEDILLKIFDKVPALESKILHALATWKRTPSRHILLGGSAHKAEN
jgi:hypothetical protein